MKFSFYIRQAVFDYILVVAAAISLTYVCMWGFYVDPAIQFSAWPGVIVAILVLLLFVVGANRKWLLIGGIIYAVIVIIGCVVAVAMTQGSPVEDVEGNYLIFFLTCAVIATMSYALARTRATSAILLIIGIFACGWIQFFYTDVAVDELLFSLIFLVAALALIIYRNFQTSARTVASARVISFPAGFLLAVSSVLVTVGVGVVVWFAIIAPLDPSVLDIKLITEYRALENVEVHGISDEYQTPDTELTSSETNDLSRTTDDLIRSSDGILTPARPLQSQDSDRQSQRAGTFLGIDIDSFLDEFDFTANPQLPWYLLFLLLILIPLAIVAYFVGRRIRRNMRLDHIREYSPASQISDIYVFLMDRLGRVGYALPAGVTPLEYASNNEPHFTRFDEAGGSTFSQLTDTYVAANFGNEVVTQEQADGFAAYYQGFWKAARRQLGIVKYFFRSFRL